MEKNNELKLLEEAKKQILISIEELNEEAFEPGADHYLIAEQLNELNGLFQKVQELIEEFEKIDSEDLKSKKEEKYEIVLADLKQETEEKYQMVLADLEKKGIVVAGKVLPKKAKDEIGSKSNTKKTKEFSWEGWENTPFGQDLLDYFRTRENRERVEMPKKAKGLDKKDLTILLMAATIVAGVGGNLIDKIKTDKPQKEMADIKLPENGELKETVAEPPLTESSSTGKEETEETALLEVYKAYVVSNEKENIEFRTEPSKEDGEVLKEIPEGATIYVHDIIKADASDKEEWKEALYLDAEEGKYISGYIEAEALAEKKEAEIVAMTNGSKEIILEGVDNGNVKFMEYKPYYVSVDTLNFRAEPSTETGEVIDSLTHGQEVYVLDSDEVLNWNDKISWKQAMYYNTTTSQYELGYLDSSYLKEPSRVVYGYEDVEITDEDRAKLRMFKESWENDALYAYKTGVTNKFTGYLSQFITEDGKYYICQTDIDLNNGTKNYGYGVNVFQKGEPNWGIVKLFKELGYDVTQDEYLHVNESKLPVEVVDKVAEMFMDVTIERIKTGLKAKNIKFTKNEILALLGITYQFGNSQEWIDWFIDEYEKNGGNTEAFKNNFITPAGYHPLKHVSGLTITRNGQPYNRGNSNWDLFHNGIFVMGAGPVAEYTVYEDEQIETETQNLTDPTEPIITESEASNEEPVEITTEANERTEQEEVIVTEESSTSEQETTARDDDEER